MGRIRYKEKDYKCSCTGDWCVGVCRDTHLHRKRKWSNPKNLCPSAERKERK